MRPNQRDDLDALRGIAILAVVLFHLNIVTYFRNGHFGVDIFFVLSGYFIFSSHCLLPNRPLFEFFSKRIWRIFPGYFLFLTLTAILAHYLLIRDDYLFFIKDLQKAACFLSNFQFDTAKGYFETVQEHSFLLHTWSLSVEIQFYIVSVLIALFLKKTGRNFAFILIFLSVGSHYFVSENVSFYSLPCRVWQFLFGYLAINFKREILLVKINEIETGFGEIYTTPLQQQLSSPDIVKTICIFFIVFLCLISTSQSNMLVQRILVTVCSCFVVSSDSTSFFQVDLLWNNKFLRFFGAISYSWYLWHWPIAVSLSYFNTDVTSLYNLTIYLFVPIGLACLSSFLFERPLLRMTHGKGDTIALALLPAILLLFGTGVVMYLNQADSAAQVFWLPNKSSESDIRRMTNSTKFNANNQERRKLWNQFSPCELADVNKLCFLGEENATDHTVIWGDSHAQTVYDAHAVLSKLLLTTRVTLISRSDCRPFFDCAYINGPTCAAYIPRDYEKLRNMSVNRVILASRYILSDRAIKRDYYGDKKASQAIMLQCVNSTVRKLLEIGMKEIILLQPIPEANFIIPQELEKAFKFGWKNLSYIDIERAKDAIIMADVRAVMKKVADSCSVCSLLDPSTVLCDQTVCPTFFTEGDFARAYYLDDNHLGDYGTNKLSRLFDRPTKTGR